MRPLWYSGVPAEVPVFAAVADPVGAGIADSLAHPGGKFGRKIPGAPQGDCATRDASGIIRNAANPAGIALFGALRNAAQSLGVEASPINVRDAREIERSIEAFARSPNGGLVVTQTANFHRDLIIAAAARHKLPAVYVSVMDATGGGLISYGPDVVDQFR